MPNFAPLITLCLLSIACTGQTQDMRASKDLVAASDKLVVRQGGVATEPGVAILVHQPGKLLVPQNMYRRSLFRGVF